MPELTIVGEQHHGGGGGAATFTITADQAPVKDTSVNYQVVGTAQPGQDFEPLVGTAILDGRPDERSTSCCARSRRT